jgi:hypothetical protein
MFNRIPGLILLFQLLRVYTILLYEDVTESFRTESQRNKQQQTLVEKQQKGLWRQNSLGWLTNSDTTAASGRELYHLKFSIQTASPETFGYTLVYWTLVLNLHSL